MALPTYKARTGDSTENYLQRSKAENNRQIQITNGKVGGGTTTKVIRTSSFGNNTETQKQNNQQLAESEALNAQLNNENPRNSASPSVFKGGRRRRIKRRRTKKRKRQRRTKKRKRRRRSKKRKRQRRTKKRRRRRKKRRTERRGRSVKKGGAVCAGSCLLPLLAIL